MEEKNPLLEDFDIAPFSKIKIEHYEPAFGEALKTARREIDAITQNPEPPTFQNTIEALDYSGDKLNRVAAIFFNINSANTNPEIQKIAQEVSPWLAQFQNDLTLDADLFRRVKAVYDQKSGLDLNAEQKTLLDKHYKSFSRNGANLPEDKKATLREIDAKLAQLSLKYGENVLAETNNFTLHVLNDKVLEGLPKSELEAAAYEAQAKGKKGFLFTLQAPSYRPFMKYVKNRNLRKKFSLAYGCRGFQKNEFNNENNVLKIANLRYQRAKLLGFENHADFVLRERMAKSPEKVNEFLHELLEKALPAAQREFEELEAYAKNLDGISRLETWDGAYYSNLLKQERFDLDDEALKPYFPLENVIQGAFLVAHKLYGLSFEEVFNIDKYHEEVKIYRVTDTKGDFLAVFYADFHPRQGKRNGAWMTTFKEQEIKNGRNNRPQASIVCNFSRPVENSPALLSFEEVTTLFHEFGHSLHAMLANTTYPSISGTSVYWDFVELPSQLMENWCYEREALELFARHYQTGETIPMELIEKIRKASNFQEGMQTVRQISFGLLDMAWHGTDPTKITSVKDHELEAFASTRLYPDVPGSCMSTSFGHIFQGGYSAGYYSYKWAEVLDADAFSYFKEKGIFNKEVADKFRENILTKGGTEDPMVLYKRFRGKEPTPNALLKRAGLL